MVSVQGIAGNNEGEFKAETQFLYSTVSYRPQPLVTASYCPQPIVSAGPMEDEAPTQWVPELGEKVTVSCGLSFVDFEGHADARAFRAILAAVAPRALVLLRARPPDKLAARAAAAKSGCRRAAAPAPGETIDISSGVKTFKVRLPDDFLAGLHFETVGTWEVARVRAQLCAPGVETAVTETAVTETAVTEGAPVGAGAMEVEMEEVMADDEDEDLLVVPLVDGAVGPVVPLGARLCHLRPLLAVPESAAFDNISGKGVLVEHGEKALISANTGTDWAVTEKPYARDEKEPSFITNGDLRLSELRAVLTKAGLTAEFESGVLLVNGCVRLRRGGTGQVAIDGPWCDDYFTVRQLLYAQFSRI
eukprot:CAMPEP_0179930448 /NCGR_PEP_ID=MMETSP0983-20121128/10035_1 /TAXON_ID=483367 /ORGANISM="non described non described, Strain CCMP 2436" /LENGTH=361 /DNA_ID=CAMNT_0021834577 /DNA_START=51 /DNA_END=1136 /DNA_ORIENTATION=+